MRKFIWSRCPLPNCHYMLTVDFKNIVVGVRDHEEADRKAREEAEEAERLAEEKKAEEDPDALGSYYEAATVKYTFALRRNALMGETTTQSKFVVNI